MIIDIAIGKDRRSTRWQNTQIDWEEFKSRCRNTHRTSESIAEYAAATKVRQGEIKDHGAFVPAYLVNGHRRKDSVLHMSAIALDADSVVSADILEQRLRELKLEAFMYTTHSHIPEKPRFRIVVPIDKEIEPERYEPIARWLTNQLGIDQFDHTTYDVNRLMYWPSTSKDGEFIFKEFSGFPVQSEAVLSTYRNWRDSSEWPVGTAEKDRVKTGIKKQGDPTEKPGVIGLFCQTYGIAAAIGKYLRDVYEPAGDDRYTYTGGSTGGGLVVYGDQFAYSHHGTDPISGKLCNAFDLVRLHKFGGLDENAKPDTPPNRMPSYTAMTSEAMRDPEVKKLNMTKRVSSLREDFDAIELDPEDLDWMGKLDMDKKGNLHPTVSNFRIILEKDPNLCGKLRYNKFSNRSEIHGYTPWNKEYGTRNMTDADENQLKEYIETRYGISVVSKNFTVGLSNVFNNNWYHPVRDYFSSLTWDGIKRLDNLLVDYLGAEDNELNRVFTRKTFVAAVARTFEPGKKFDTMLVIVGPQGVGKSTLLKIMAGEWFSDSIGELSKTKEAAESLQAVLIMEMGELSSLKKADVDTIKLFLSKTDDQYRPPYGKWKIVVPRQNIFVGTTNDREFLVDETGNRRFWTVTVTQESKSVFIDLPKERDQIWAEAVCRYIEGEDLYLPKELEDEARARQSEFVIRDPRLEAIPDYLEMLLPDNWKSMTRWERGEYFLNEDLRKQNQGIHRRRRVSAAEIWCEVFGQPRETLNAYNAKPIKTFLRSLPGWSENKYSSDTGDYGPQRCFVRS